ncbi:MAG: DUF3617 family protein [Laribacter sp.]|nr:DUF3617 family protein [Laribacter sp.]MBP9609391.1 DUF3617 family protein [Laribacter sp.]
MKRLLILTVWCAGLPSALAAPVNMEPGLWEITIQSKMAGMPEGMPQAGKHTVRQCITPDETADARKIIRTQPGCQFDKLDTQSNHVRWKMRCKTPEGSSTSEGEMTYAGQSYQGTLVHSTVMEGQTLRTTQTMQGRRVGPCKK